MGFMRHQSGSLIFNFFRAIARARMKISLTILLSLFVLWAIPHYFSHRIVKECHLFLSHLQGGNLSIQDISASWHGITLRNISFQIDDMTIHIDMIDCQDVNHYFWTGMPSRFSDILINNCHIRIKNTFDFQKIRPYLLGIVPQNENLDRISFSRLTLESDINNFNIEATGYGYRLQDSPQDQTMAFKFTWTMPHQEQFSAESTAIFNTKFGKIITTGKNYYFETPDMSVNFTNFTKTLSHVRGIDTLHSDTHVDINTVKLPTNNPLSSGKIIMSTPLHVDMHVDIYNERYVGFVKIFPQENPTENSQKNQGKTASSKLLAYIKGHITSKGRGLFDVNIPPLNFHEIGIPLPALTDQFIYHQGKVGLKGVLSLREGKLEPEDSVIVYLDHVDFSTPLKQTDFVEMQGVTGQINVCKFFPFVTNQEQSCYMQHVMIDHLPLDDVNIFFSCHEKNSWQIHHMAASFFGGELNLHTFTPTPQNGLKFRGILRNIDLKKITDFAHVNILEITGQISGNGNFIWKDQQIGVLNADFKLSSSEAILKYMPDIQSTYSHASSHQQIENKTPQNTEKAFEALKNLRCTIMNLSISPLTTPAHTHDVLTKLKIIGFNPQVLGGYPFEFNIESSGLLRDILKNTINKINP